jgi:pimeloyl-ACP methyl ester carboxylesterase
MPNDTPGRSEGTGRIERYDHDGLTFDVTDTGPADGQVVILLHGFPEDRQSWDQLAAPLAAAGYRTLALDQRGYSPGARPAGRRAYTLDLLAGDVLALADTAGADRVHLVGHDWGAALAWYLAAAHPDRVLSLTALSVPHGRAFVDALARSSQLLHSWYLLFFQGPRLPEWLLTRPGESRLAEALRRDGLDEDSARRYAQRAMGPGALTGPINWYRALPFRLHQGPGLVDVPALYVWGDKDRYVTRVAAERCARYVSAPFRFVVLPGATHWLPSTSADALLPLVLEHLAGVER